MGFIRHLRSSSCIRGRKGVEETSLNFEVIESPVRFFLARRLFFLCFLPSRGELHFSTELYLCPSNWNRVGPWSSPC